MTDKVDNLRQTQAEQMRLASLALFDEAAFAAILGPTARPAAGELRDPAKPAADQ